MIEKLTFQYLLRSPASCCLHFAAGPTYMTDN